MEVDMALEYPKIALGDDVEKLTTLIWALVHQ